MIVFKSFIFSGKQMPTKRVIRKPSTRVLTKGFVNWLNQANALNAGAKDR